MRDNGYEFEILIDDGYSRSAGVAGIPTTWFLDREGNKAFEIRGMIDELEKEYAARIDLLASSGRDGAT